MSLHAMFKTTMFAVYDTVARIGIIKMEGLRAVKIAARVYEALELVEPKLFKASLWTQLLGSQWQCFSLARALIKRPLVLLLNEPLCLMQSQAYQ